MKKLTLASVAVALILLAGCAARQEAPSDPPAPAAAQGPGEYSGQRAPFAKIRMEVSGCMSCGHCRDAMRKVARQMDSTSRIEFGGDAVQVVYLEPRTLEIPELVRRLTDAGILQFKVHQVWLTATGLVRKNASGYELALSGTGQTIPLAGAPDKLLDQDVQVEAKVLNFERPNRLALEIRRIVTEPIHPS